MTGQWYRRIDERDQGRLRLSRLTGWTATAAVALAGVFGLAFARHDRAAAAPVDQNQITGNTGSTGDNGGTGTGGNTGGNTGDSGGVTGVPDNSGGGGVIQPPAQPPTITHGRGGHGLSGGS